MDYHAGIHRVEELREKRADLLDRMRAILNKADGESRDEGVVLRPPICGTADGGLTGCRC